MSTFMTAASCRLFLRGTFIDVEEAQEEVAQHQHVLRRSQSEPTICSQGCVPNIFDDERAYVTTLSGKLSSASWDFGRPGQPFERRYNGAMYSGNEQVSTMLLRAKVDKIPGDDEQTEAPNAVERIMSLSTSSDFTTGFARGVSDADQSTYNIGSIGHPYLCSRPCLHFAEGRCENGRSCDFCHVTHAKRLVHLKKNQREHLRTMDSGRAKVLLLNAVERKVVEHDTTRGSLAAVERLADACNVRTCVNTPPTCAEETLVSALDGLSLRLLLITLQQTVAPSESLALIAVDELLAQLRHVAASTSSRALSLSSPRGGGVSYRL